MNLSTLLGALLFFTPTLAKPSSGCGQAPKLISASSTTTPLTLTINSKSRTFFVLLPANYNASTPHRLILTLHALGGNAGQVVSGTSGYLPWYGIPPLASNSSIPTIYVAPNGVSNGWGNQAGEDVTFIRSVISTVESDVCIETSLRFSTGFSYGGAMSYSLACSLGSELRAVAALSGNPTISGCAGGTDAVAYYGQHGVSDTVLPITGGRQMRDRFVKNNGCTAVTAAEPAAGSGKRIKTVYSGCKEGKPVVWVAFDGPHTPTPREGGELWTAGETWEFFGQFGALS